MPLCPMNQGIYRYFLFPFKMSEMKIGKATYFITKSEKHIFTHRETVTMHAVRKGNRKQVACGASPIVGDGAFRVKLLFF